jgi:hypothetical protein
MATWQGWNSDLGTHGLDGIVGVPSVASSQPNQLDFFFTNKDGFLQYKKLSLSNNTWTDVKTWTDKKLKGPPAVAANGANVLDIFVRGEDDHLYHTFWNGSMFGGWDDMDRRGTDAILIGPPVAASSKNRTDVFVIGRGNHVSHSFWKAGGSGWTLWDDLNKAEGTVIGASAVASEGANFLDLFALSLDGPAVHLHHISSDGTKWSKWDNLSGKGDERTFIGAPAAVSIKGKNRVDVFARDAKDHKVYHIFWQAGLPGWSAWSPVGNSTLMGQPSHAQDLNDRSYPVAVVPMGTEQIHTIGWMTDRILRRNRFM